MKFSRSLLAMAISSAFILTACGGDGGGGPLAAAPATTTLSGVAMAGAVDGDVCAFRIDVDGTVSVSDPLACTKTDAATGAYKLSWEDYAGAVLVKVWGRYIDEATKKLKTITEADPMRSALTCTTASCDAAVTPLTELAVRSAASWTESDLQAAYLHVAQVIGLDVADAQMAIAELVSNLPSIDLSAGENALNHAHLLAVVSQAQANACGDDCDQDDYLQDLQDNLDDATYLRNQLDGAFAAAEAETGVACRYEAAKLICTLPTTLPNNQGDQNGQAGQDSGANNPASGNYRLTIETAVMGTSAPAIELENIEKPASQEEFCDADDVTGQLDDIGTSWTMNSCTFDGTNGLINATIGIEQGGFAVDMDYTITYTYTAM